MPTWEMVAKDVPKVATRYRTIVTPIPAPGSIAILEELRKWEPQSMSGQPPILWDKAVGFQISDRWGNTWLDWSSGVLVANAGHSHPKIVDAITEQAKSGLLHNYCFPSEIRATLARELAGVAPEGLDKVFLLTTGAETTECAIKLSRTQGHKIAGKNKLHIVSFANAFHGRTMGSQMAGGIPALKQWIINLDPAMVQVPFPDGYRNPDTSFEGFLTALKQQNVAPGQVAGVILETYQGGTASFAPREYMQQLRKWCDEHKVVLTMDEVQAGFGRCGTFWGFQHYGITPDLICCGKGITSGLPLSAVIGRAELMDLYPPGSMTSTHTGNPVCAASALANLHAIQEEHLVENARKMGEVLHKELQRIAQRFPGRIGATHGKGLVAAVQIVKNGTTEPDGEAAWTTIRKCVEAGLMLFSPVGPGGGSVKICPPLTITEDAVKEGASVLEEALESVL
jgi:4-aminobutyrate aminotransferase/(S)-3-amino-2-methylpropionate transaminase